MGCVYPRGRKLWIKYKKHDGSWKCEHTDYQVGEEETARVLLEKIEAEIAQGKTVRSARRGGPTLSEYAEEWIAGRKERELADWKNDEARLREHVLPELGTTPIAKIRPRHVLRVLDKLKKKRSKVTKKPLAPRTTLHVYGTLRSLFRHAMVEDLITASPCSLPRHLVPECVDRDPEWRSQAVFAREELVTLISDPRIAEDRRLFYGFEGLAALRLGEVAGLRFRSVNLELQPLGRIVVATSYDKGKPKNKRPREMPIHPALAEMLCRWKNGGWRRLMGRDPTPDDLVLPFGRTQKYEAGRMRDKNAVRKQFLADLVTVDLRHRRGHDMRRTSISLAIADGARKDVLSRCTHDPGKKSASAFDLYLTLPWATFCEEVAKLKIPLGETMPTVVRDEPGLARTPVDDHDDRLGEAAHPRAGVRHDPGPARRPIDHSAIAVPVVAAPSAKVLSAGSPAAAAPPAKVVSDGGPSEAPATVRATVFREHESSRGLTKWRRRESNLQ
jgi:integrase